MNSASASWVYYKRLLRDATRPKVRPELIDVYGEGMSTVAQARFDVRENVHGNDGNMLISMAYNELAKEQALLNQIFGVSINFDFRQPNAIRDLIDTLNACLNLKDVYERNKQIITATNNKGQKGVYSYFNTYLLQAFDKRRDAIQKQVVAKFLNRETFFEAVKSTLTQEFDNIIIPEAIELMLSAGVERGVDDEDMRMANAYKEILRAIQNFPNNPLAEGLKRGWGIDTLIDKMASEIAGASDSGSLKKMFNKYSYEEGVNKNGKTVSRRRNTALRKLISGTKHFNDQASGLSLEAMEGQILTMITGGIPDFTVGNGNFQIQGHVEAKTLKNLGYKGMRPDGAVIFNVGGGNYIEQEIDKVNSNDHKDAIDLFNRVGQYVSNIKDGFIVYTSDKNYALTDSFKKRGGFSAGADLSLDMLEGILGRFVSNVDNLIITLLNAGKGAIREGDTGEASKVLARAIAFALFDDWDYIGTAKQDMGGNAIHVMNLNGVLIPLSVFLFSLGDAVAQAQANVSAFATASVHTASYKTGSYDPIYGLPNWHNAITYGKENTTVSFHFMKSISSFLRF